MRLPWIAELVIADVHHRVRSTASTESCLVRAELAAPQRRRIAVTTGLPGRPECILVDPVGHARFLYDIDAADS